MTDKQRNACELLRHVVDESVKRLGPSGEGEGERRDVEAGMFTKDGTSRALMFAEQTNVLGAAEERSPTGMSEAAEGVADGGRPVVAPTGESEDGQGGM